jgi:hypothetical protein
MVIRNPDGTVYKPAGTLSQLIPDSPTHDLFDLWDQEVIKLGGSPLLYYEVIIPQSAIDKQYIEARTKLWTQHPVEIFAVYDPVPSPLDQGLFGIDGPTDMVFYTNYRATLNAIGHLPIIGSRIWSPHLRENWEVIDRKLGDFYRFNVFRCEIHCKRFQETLTTGEGQVTQQTQPPDQQFFEID